MASNLEISLVKYLCPICGKVAEKNIILNSELTEEAARKVKELHNKAVGFSDKACDECVELGKKGIIGVFIDKEKSDGTLEGMYRTGNLCLIDKTKFTEETNKTSNGVEFIFIADEDN